MPVGLRRIRVHRDPMVAADRAQLLHRLDHTDFVVGHHHAHQLRIRLDGLFQLCRLNQAIGPGREQRQFEAFLSELLQGIEHRMMLAGHADQVPRASSGPGAKPGVTEQGQVVGFGGATGEDHLVAFDSEAVGQGVPGGAHGCGCRKAQAVLAA